MGITHLLHYSTFTGSITAAQRSYHSSFFSISRIPDNTHIHNPNRLFSTISRFHSPSHGGDGGPRRDSNTDPSIGLGNEGGDEFEPRVWWSNAAEDEDEDEDDELQGFGVLEEAINVGLVFKVLKAFGWMIPAILMWILVGNVPNTFFMALAIPIAQSAVDLMTNQNRRTKKRARASNRTRMAKKRRDEDGIGRERRQTSKTSNNSSKKTSKDVADSFGGWDELDNNNNKRVVFPKSTLRVMGNAAKEEGERRLSKRVTSREKPLMVRLLIAAFPFLGTWMKVM
ncbi:uncharacterized protein LOC124926377 [Impatiens glandulifera]|uniref:uncharacterized protein LOC124926377 n=1 Tax=Impatiens glandulifera TaxID=253017 RepID=UPI001FB12131|nr:uncharacterized protein LOC124926377 [Impatiens glandulifera]